jgi:hypothetical protein
VENVSDENVITESGDKVECEMLGALQGVVGMTIMDVMKSRDKYLDIILPESMESKERPLIETILVVLTKLKVIESQILAAVVEAEGGEASEPDTKLPVGVLEFVRQFSHDSTLGLLLLNEFITPQELKSIYRSDELVTPLRVYENREGNTVKSSVLDAASNLKDLVEKHRDGKGSLNKG